VLGRRSAVAPRTRSADVKDHAMCPKVAGSRDYPNDIGSTPGSHHHASYTHDGTCPAAAFHLPALRPHATAGDLGGAAPETETALARGMQVSSGQVCPRCREREYVSGLSWLGRSWTECLACGDAWTGDAPTWE
jgi:hypothetical protein